MLLFAIVSDNIIMPSVTVAAAALFSYACCSLLLHRTRCSAGVQHHPHSPSAFSPVLNSLHSWSRCCPLCSCLHCGLSAFCSPAAQQSRCRGVGTSTKILTALSGNLRHLLNTSMVPLDSSDNWGLAHMALIVCVNFAEC